MEPLFSPLNLLQFTPDLLFVSEKDRPALRPARSMDSLSAPSYPNEGAVTHFEVSAFGCAGHCSSGGRGGVGGGVKDHANF